MNENRNNVLALGLRSVIIVGSIGIVIYALSASLGSADWGAWLRYVGFGLLLASASFASGGLFGFLFGIPKPSPDDKSTNTSLEQISDWLSKILVGAGLAQLTVLPGWAWRVATRLAEGLGGPTGSAGFVLCLAVFLAIAGFVILYLWSRAHLPGILASALQKNQELEAAVEDKQRVLRDTEEQQRTTRNLLDQVTLRLGKEGQRLPIRPVTDPELPIRIPPGRIPDDPWKGQFGESAAAHGCRLSAQVRARLDTDELFDVHLRVESVDEAHPLKGSVVFFLHSTFPDDKILVEVREGVAELEITSWGAFTVGAMTYDGQALLELDLATLADAPRKFAMR